MIDPVLQAAYNKLLGKLNGMLEEVNSLKRMLNMLAEEAGIDDRFEIEGRDASPSSISVRPDQFTGKKLATSVTEILNLYKKALPLDEIMNILRMGGYQWDTEKAAREGIQKNTTTFKLANKDGSIYGLKSWYEKPKKRKNGDQSDTSEQGPEIEADSEGGTEAASESSTQEN